jgi:hypothetical protein
MPNKVNYSNPYPTLDPRSKAAETQPRVGTAMASFPCRVEQGGGVKVSDQVAAFVTTPEQ